MAEPQPPKPPARKPIITDDVLFRHEVSGIKDHPAKVTRVIEGDVVNLFVMFDGGTAMAFLKVRYDAGDAEAKPAREPAKGTWRWPPPRRPAER